MPVDAATGRVQFTLPGHPDPVINVVWSPDGKGLASGGSDHTLRHWKIRTGEELGTIGDTDGTFYLLAIARDGEILAAWLRGLPPTEALERGLLLAARAVARVGARP